MFPAYCTTSCILSLYWINNLFQFGGCCFQRFWWRRRGFVVQEKREVYKWKGILIVLGFLWFHDIPQSPLQQYILIFSCVYIYLSNYIALLFYKYIMVIKWFHSFNIIFSYLFLWSFSSCLPIFMILFLFNINIFYFL